MGIATVTSAERGATDRLFDAIVTRLSAEGVRIAGAVRPVIPDVAPGHCESDLLLLPDGPIVRITQDLGPGSTACRMDAGALEQAVGLATARLAEQGADLVVLNKFGLSEAEGRGFRGLIADALGQGVPVLIGLSDTHRAAFERFSEGLSRALPPDEMAIVDWFRATAGVDADMAENV
ncbi:DUF2478 domain-containing protein [Oceaniglobus indicus]|uniref:DUF2478 domain-containing protein n=1 Tax=Oceaniglobus indicus TaxID=2047749 RepID=UPI000C193EEC|nr:DUF2478 domain-containing protein [Oceaniglobus indicus]